jgi:Flp pilus assembly protein TadG
MKKLLRRLRSDESGSATIEAIIWIPIFVWVLVVIVNASVVLYQKNEAYRIVQNANRVLSTGYMKTEAETEAFIQDRLAGIAPEAVVTTRIVDGIVTSDVSYTLDTLFMPHVVRDLMNLNVSITAQHFMEY